MTLKLVLDTNLIVSAHINPDGLERLVLNLALSDHVEFYFTPKVLAEYEEMLGRKKFGLDPTLLRKSLKLIKNIGNLGESTCEVSVSSDPGDNKFLECAESVAADYLVTGNKRHFPKRWKTTKVVNARELIELITLELNQ